MIVDSSAIVAIVNGEPEAEAFATAIERAEQVSISAATLLESCIKLDAQGIPAISRRLDRLIASVPIEVIDVTVEQVAIAREAYVEYGKGSGSAARLNFGDCFSYALAFAKDEPLLFKGGDFSQTDLKSAV